MIFPYLIFLVIAVFFFYVVRNWRNRKFAETAVREISHFSNIGFSNLLESNNIEILVNKIAIEGKSVNEWKMMQFGQGIELWTTEYKSKDYVLEPFFRSAEYLLKSEKSFPTEKHEGFKLLTLSADDVEVFAEMIPFSTEKKESVYLTAFGIEVTLYDSVRTYETEVKANFKKQIISLAHLRYMENPETAIPSAEIIISGIIKEHERKVNQETSTEFWNVKIEIKENFILNAVWDYRLVDRFPQRGNVLVGNFYLFGSQENLD